MSIACGDAMAGLARDATVPSSPERTISRRVGALTRGQTGVASDRTVTIGRPEYPFASIDDLFNM
jgi:hypothetical protein